MQASVRSRTKFRYQKCAACYLGVEKNLKVFRHRNVCGLNRGGKHRLECNRLWCWLCSWLLSRSSSRRGLKITKVAEVFIAFGCA